MITNTHISKGEKSRVGSLFTTIFRKSRTAVSKLHIRVAASLSCQLDFFARLPVDPRHTKCAHAMCVRGHYSTRHVRRAARALSFTVLEQLIH